jgi:hypothetical protein
MWERADELERVLSKAVADIDRFGQQGKGYGGVPTPQGDDGSSRGLGGGGEGLGIGMVGKGDLEAALDAWSNQSHC